MSAPRADDDYDYLFKGAPLRTARRRQRQTAAPAAPGSWSRALRSRRK